MKAITIDVRKSLTIGILLLGIPVLSLAQFIPQGHDGACPSRGLTGTMEPPSICIGQNLAKMVPSGHRQRDMIKHVPPSPPLTDNWILIDSWTDDIVLHSNTAYSVYFDPAAQSLSAVIPTNELNSLCWQAINRAPHWLRNDLFEQLTHITYEYFRDRMAQLIVDTPDPYVDEIAFCVAHVSRQLVGGGITPEDLLLENARSIYEADTYLDYVWLCDYGNSSDDDYWTTVRYRVKTAQGDTIEVELEREYYYWFIVHPRLSDEFPVYVDPNSGQYQPPPTGKFWRDYLFNHADEGYPLLRDAMAGCQVLWSNLHNNGTPANGAVGSVTQWINDVMDWGAGSERPIQPNRIYHLHCGNCGEYSDITAAAGRVCLIPTVCTIAFTNDHTWNEFWDGHWFQWEPVNNMVSDTLAYEAWGHEFPTVINYNGDGSVETVTERYCSGSADLNITIIDAFGTPVDGVKISMESQYLYGGMDYCTWAFTNSDGFTTLKIGENRDIYLRLDSPVGHYPSGSGQVVLAVDSALAGITYEWTYQLGGVEIQPVLPATEPPNPSNRYHLEVSLEMPTEIIRDIIWSNSEFSQPSEFGTVDFVMLDGVNFQDFQAGEASYGFQIGRHTGSGQISFTLPTDSAWYAVISNVDRVANSSYVTVAVNLYEDSEQGIGSRMVAMKPEVFWLGQNYPNPFNPMTTISYNLPMAGLTRLALYNLLGQEVAVLLDSYQGAGLHRVVVDGSRLASGIYLYKIETGNCQATKTMTLIK